MEHEVLRRGVRSSGRGKKRKRNECDVQWCKKQKQNFMTLSVGNGRKKCVGHKVVRSGVRFSDNGREGEGRGIKVK